MSAAAVDGPNLEARPSPCGLEASVRDGLCAIQAAAEVIDRAVNLATARRLREVPSRVRSITKRSPAAVGPQSNAEITCKACPVALERIVSFISWLDRM